MASMSGRERKIKAKHDREFQDRRRENYVRSRLNREYADMRNQGMTPEQIFAAQGAAQATTPGAVTAGPNPYANATAAPAWAQQSQAGPATTPAGPFQAAIQGMIDRKEPAAKQWWQQGTPTQPATTAPGAPKVMPRPAELGGAAPGTIGGRTVEENQPTGVAGLAMQAGRSSGDYVPQWLSWWNNRQPTGVAGLAMQAGGLSTTPGAVTTPTGTTGTKGGRNVDPNTGIPDFPMLSSLGSQPPTSYYGGGGSSWYKRRGGGGGRGRSFTPFAPWPRRQMKGRGNQPYVPSSGLANWSIG
jgi:hypothetical protein